MPRLLWVAALLGCAASAQPPDKVGQLAHEIHELAQLEPPLFGCDTRLQLGEMLRKRDRRLSVELLHETVELFSSVRDRSLTRALGGRAVALALLVEPDEAENVIRVLPRDMRSRAYDTVVGQWFGIDRKRAKEILFSALEQGAFRMESGIEMVAALSREEPAEAHELFARMLRAFPASDASEWDVLYLLDCAKFVAGTNRGLTVQAVERAFSVIEGARFKEPAHAGPGAAFTIEGEAFRTHSASETVLFRIAAFLNAYQPGLYADYSAKLETVANAAGRVTADNFERATQPELSAASAAALADAGPWKYNDAGASLSKKRFDDALAAAEAEPDAGARSLLLFGLSSRDDATQQQRRRVRHAFVISVREVKPVLERLRRLAAFLQRGGLGGLDPESAAEAVAEFATSAASLCRCELREETPACESGTGCPACLDLYSSVAASAFRLDVAVADPVLRSRLLLRALARLIS